MAGFGSGDILFKLYDSKGNEINVLDNDIKDEDKVTYELDDSKNDSDTRPAPYKYTEWIQYGKVFVNAPDDFKEKYPALILSTNPNYFKEKLDKKNADCNATSSKVWYAGTNDNIKLLIEGKQFRGETLSYYKERCIKCHTDKKDANYNQCDKILKSNSGGRPTKKRNKTKTTKKRTKTKITKKRTKTKTK